MGFHGLFLDRGPLQYGQSGQLAVMQHTHHLLERSLGVAGELGKELPVVLVVVSIMYDWSLRSNQTHLVGAGHAEQGGSKELALFVVEPDNQVADIVLLGSHVDDVEMRRMGLGWNAVRGSWSAVESCGREGSGSMDGDERQNLCRHDRRNGT
jgi:hypothetical protein